MKDPQDTSLFLRERRGGEYEAEQQTGERAQSSAPLLHG
jgi:hypothetical protein